MPARLFCKAGALAGSTVQIDTETTIGRSPDNGLVLSSPDISGHHARIGFDSGRNSYFIEDLGSGNGTMVDGMPVDGQAFLEAFHVVTFSKRHDFFFQRLPDVQPAVESKRAPAPVPPEESGESKTTYGGFKALGQLPIFRPSAQPPIAESAAPEPAHPSQQAPSPELEESDTRTVMQLSPGLGIPSFGSLSPSAKAADEGPPPPQFVLKLEFPDGAKEFRLVQGENTLGRSADCEIQVDHPTISRRHATLTVRSSDVTLRDLGSSNGSKADGEPVAAPTVLKSGVDLRFGVIEGKLTQE